MALPTPPPPRLLSPRGNDGGSEAPSFGGPSGGLRGAGGSLPDLPALPPTPAPKHGTGRRQPPLPTPLGPGDGGSGATSTADAPTPPPVARRNVSGMRRSGSTELPARPSPPKGRPPPRAPPPKGPPPKTRPPIPGSKPKPPLPAGKPKVHDRSVSRVVVLRFCGCLLRVCLTLGQLSKPRCSRLFTAGSIHRWRRFRQKPIGACRCRPSLGPQRSQHCRPPCITNKLPTPWV